ncbi:NUDIX hydrolase [Priestia flexa]|jgi:ADP-ribose pyrophosphatase YjhB (NUDIX family)|uniref:NUDIX hydrolase n=1 Tax=Priestia flexa TaxID=86664 RepID=A0A8I1MI88_9BACI|nr:NUDIX hydrolase [Priestia flexa]AQX56173.1 ADP-ribose pyrophosphatase [Priestia flexa]MBN8252787.1 NUDIX hydrolase [Priestia flexa]MBN8435202.1 NUDIX hydrolase [Priestia flexa]MBY6087754.1 NUDIX hydrolase [Priestia flexa]MCA0967880.1 NUDIX hydrolase [Priestia flexa]
MEIKWLDWAKELQAIAQAGLTYSKDMYDIERFEMIRDLSIEMMAKQTGTPQKVVKELFANETGYATPKVDVRAVIFKGNKILMVKEKLDGHWALPGGWADIGLTAKEVAVKEVREEAGYNVQPIKLLAVLDKKCHPHPPSPYHVYKLFIQCEITGGSGESGMETSDVGFFAEDELPPLSVERNTESQIKQMFDCVKEPNVPTYFD